MDIREQNVPRTGQVLHVDTRTTRFQRYAALTVLTAITFAAAGIGGWVTSTSVNDWYPSLAKPAWNPPDWLFGPVWTILYLLMATAAWLVWLRSPRPIAVTAMTLYGVQLALNVGWSMLFFGFRSPALALLEIGVLWAAIAAMTLLFWRQSRLAAILLFPYLGWTGFAAILNFTLWRMN